MTKMNIMTFDLEEWHLYDLYPKGGHSYFLPIIEGYLDRLLDLLDAKNYKATFFCLGIIAQEYPHIILKIANRGHEIACHSYKHLHINKMTPETFRQDTRLAIDCLQELTGEKVDKYRAPSFSMRNTWQWALEILAEEGIKYDSSIFSSGININQKEGKWDVPFQINLKGSILYELPIGYHSIFGNRCIYSGGGFFRFFPYKAIKKWMNAADYNMTYFHIRDFDKDQKRVVSSRYFLSYFGVNGAYKKFGELIDDFGFLSVEQAVNRIEWEKGEIIYL